MEVYVNKETGVKIMTESELSGNWEKEAKKKTTKTTKE